MKKIPRDPSIVAHCEQCDYVWVVWVTGGKGLRKFCDNEDAVGLSMNDNIDPKLKYPCREIPIGGIPDWCPLEDAC